MYNIQYSLKSHMKIMHLFEHFLCSSNKKLFGACGAYCCIFR